MSETVFKLEKFDAADYDKFISDYKQDVKLEENAKGKEIDKEDFKFALNPTILSPVAKVDVKGLEFEDKKRFLKLCLSCNCIDNAVIVSNLVVLAQGRLIEEELYESEDVFFNDDIEFLDICTDLRDDILEFNTQIVTYFLAALKSMASLIGDGAEHIPNTFFIALQSYTMKNISVAMQKVSVNYDELPKVLNGDVVINSICAEATLVGDFMTDLIKQITDE